MIPEERDDSHQAHREQPDVFFALGSCHQAQVEDQRTLHLNKYGPQVDVVLRAVASGPKIEKAPHVPCPVVHLGHVGRVLLGHRLRPRSGKVFIALGVGASVPFVEAEVDVVSSDERDSEGREVEPEHSSKERTGNVEKSLCSRGLVMFVKQLDELQSHQIASDAEEDLSGGTGI